MPNITRTQRVTWRRRSRDHSIRHMPFHIDGPLEPSLYLQTFSAYSSQHMLSSTSAWSYAYYKISYVKIRAYCWKNIKYAYDTLMITQVGRKNNVHTVGPHVEASVPEGGVALTNKVGSSQQTA